MALITKTDLENRLGRTLTATESSAFTIINDSAQALVERILNTEVESVSPSTRYYDGGVQYLEIDPCTDLTAVCYVDDDQNVIDTISSSEYTLDPNIRAVKTMIRYRVGRFPRGFNNIAVTAKFSIYDDADTLAIVKNALLDILTQTIENKENITSESIEGYSVSYGELKETSSIKALNTISQGII